MAEPLFYLRSRHGDTGNNVMFHAKMGSGYTTNLDDLHLFTIAEAQKQLGYSIRSLPLLADEVDKLSIKAVDMQNLDHEKNNEHKKNSPDVFNIQLGGHYNGNDIAFITGSGVTYDYSKAETFTVDAAQKYLLAHQGDSLFIWNQAYLDSIARRTFQSHNINTRSMTTKPGIVYKKPRKKRPTTGKTRINCPDCGRIHWQYNPYDFEGCAHISCKGWRSSY